MAEQTKMVEQIDGMVEKKLDELNYLPNFLVNMINEFMIYHKNINNKPDNLTFFDGINVDDFSSTNYQIEDFYAAQYKFMKYDLEPNSIKTKIFHPDEYEDDNNETELFGLRQDDNLIYVSQSLFALLIEIVNLKNEDTTNKIKYDIVPMRRE